MKSAFLFPGQGSQSVGMLSALAERHDIVARTFVEAGQAIDLDLWALVQEGPGEKLDRTEITQPALLAAGVAVWRCWESLNDARPAFLAGHSLGEYTALVCAEALDFADAVRLVAARGRFMQEAVPAGHGAMAAILGLDDADIATICEQVAGDEVVQPANYNSPGQVVISGHAAAVARASEKCLEAGARRALPLAVSVPSHSALMASAGQRLAEALTTVEIHAPQIPVIHNFDVSVHVNPDNIRTALVQQLSRPVRWTETVRKLAGEGVSRAAECGPGRVLGGLVKRIDRAIECAALEQPDTLEATAKEFS